MNLTLFLAGSHALPCQTVKIYPPDLETATLDLNVFVCAKESHLSSIIGSFVT